MFARHLFGIDRKIYYRKTRRVAVKRNKAGQVVALMREIRNTMPRIGTRKLYCLLADQLGKLKAGRDKFFDILRANHLLIHPKRNYHVTANSHHRF